MNKTRFHEVDDYQKKVLKLKKGESIETLENK